jgi:hypothetical protein
MDPPDGPLAPLPGAETVFRILPPKVVSAHIAHSEQKQMAFRLFSQIGDIYGNGRWRAASRALSTAAGAAAHQKISTFVLFGSLNIDSTGGQYVRSHFLSR